MDDFFDDEVSGTDYEDPSPETAAENAKKYHRYSKSEKAELFDKILEQKHRMKLSWDEIAAKHGVARSTIADWRKTDDWRLAEARWRRIMREESRTDVTMMGQDMLGILQELAHNAKSEFVRYSAAGKLIDLVGIDDEAQETLADGVNDLTKFLQQQARSREARARMQAQAEIGKDDDLLALEVKPGGMLPAEITRLNEELVAKRQAEQEALEAEFVELEAKPASEPKD